MEGESTYKVLFRMLENLIYIGTLICFPVLVICFAITEQANTGIWAILCGIIANDIEGRKK